MASDKNIELVNDEYLERLATRQISRKDESAYNRTMDFIPRPELDAKLETIEARMDTRVASIEGMIKEFAARSDEREKRLTELASRAVQSAERADAAAESASNLKSHFWASVAAQIVAVAAILVGAYYANQQSTIGMLQLFQSIQSTQQPVQSAPKP